MLTSLVEKYVIYFNVQAEHVQYMLMVIAALSLILILTVVSSIPQNSDICQVLQNLSSNLTASQKHRTERNNKSNTLKLSQFVFINVCFWR